MDSIFTLYVKYPSRNVEDRYVYNIDEFHEMICDAYIALSHNATISLNVTAATISYSNLVELVEKEITL